MKHIKLKKKFNSNLKGIPKPDVLRLKNSLTVALLPSKIPFVKTGLLVHEGDRVSIGTPLFHDKRDTRIKFLSPGEGVVEKIVFGPRRVIQEIVVRLCSEEKNQPFENMENPFVGCTSIAETVASLSRQELIELLMQFGMWHMFRQFPFMDIADDKTPFPMIIVSLQPGDMFSPSAGVILDGQEAFFLSGLSVLKKLSEVVVVAAPEKFISSVADLKSPDLKKIAKEITHVTGNHYPEGDPGVILYKIRKNATQNSSVTIAPQDLIAIGEFFSTGRFPLYRIYTVAGNSKTEPCHIMARLGCPVDLLTGDIPSGHGVITGGVFTGSIVSSYSTSAAVLSRDPRMTDAGISASCSHMGTHDYSAVVLKQSSEDQLFGFLSPGFDSVTESRTFISSFLKGRKGHLSKDAGFPTDMNLHGEERPCINCGLCDKKCPVDLLPQFIMKAARAGEIEEIVEMGLLDCTLCGLCAFVCPSKIDLSGIMNSEKQAYYKEIVTG